MIAIFYLVLQILKIYSYVVIANVVISWLVAFNVLNTQNRFVFSILDFTYRLTEPLFSKISFTSRYVLFKTPTYDSRIYAYENDVLYGYSIPAYYGKGSKIYLVAKCNIIHNLDYWLLIAQTTYTDRMVLKSGWDEIEGNKMTEIKLQLRYKF